MRIKNTSRYPDEEVRRLVRFGAGGVRSARIEVHVKNSKYAFAGRIYLSTADLVFSGFGDMTLHHRASQLIVLRIGAPKMFPLAFHYRGLKRAPTYLLCDWKEALVTTAAHEFCHARQHRRGKPSSEVKAERWAVKKLEEFREEVPDCGA